MSISALDAATAYGRAAIQPKFDDARAVSSQSGAAAPGFGDIVEKMVTDTASSLRAAEEAGARQVAGKGDLVDTVTAIGAAEVALDTVVAVRDRVVNAYTEIMRMQI